MKILKFIYVLYKLRLFSPVGLYRLIAAIHNYGMNTMALLKLAERFGNKEALVDDHETISFQELFIQSERLSQILAEKYELGSGQKVGFLCRNHASMIKSIFAVSRVGADIYFLNTEMSKSQLQLLIEEHNFDLLIYDEEFHTFIEKSIASGGAELNPKLTNDVFGKLGDVLYNLYGTSETGLNMIATPKDLKHSPKTVGKKIHGIPLKILDSNKKEVEAGTVGQFCVKNPWSMRNKEASWVETGDLGYQDQQGYYFLCGRSDDMIVSAGENVFPLELEHILINHPAVEDVAVIGISDEQFGQRLRAFVQPYATAKVSEDELFDWLRPRSARFQVPKNIIIVDKIPYTPLGKLDRKQLAAEGSWNKIHNIK